MSRKTKRIITNLIVWGIIIGVIAVNYRKISGWVAENLIRFENDVKTTKMEAKNVVSTFTYEDSKTGYSLQYLLHQPDGYDSKETYSLLLFVGDENSLGTGVTTTLSAGLGATIWETTEEQAKRPCFVVIPEFTEPLIKEDGSVSEYVELIKGLLADIEGTHNIDTKRIYAVGQGMGSEALMYLAANNDNLFYKELFVGGRFDYNQLSGLTHENFISIASAGDKEGFTGQKEIKTVLKNNNVVYNEMNSVHASNYSALNNTVSDSLGDGNNSHFITFTKGSCLPFYMLQDSDERILSYNYAFRFESIREWLFK